MIVLIGHIKKLAEDTSLSEHIHKCTLTVHLDCMCSRAVFGKRFSYSCVLIVAAVRRVVASSSLTQSLKGIATAGIVILPCAWVHT